MVSHKIKSSESLLCSDFNCQLSTKDMNHIFSHLPAHSVTSHPAYITKPFSFSDIISTPPLCAVSHGSIKRPPKTIFSNSSPMSYKTLPAFSESVNFDKTSFVEKSFITKPPANYHLEVATLFALSNKSELECTYTNAPTSPANDKTRKSIQNLSETMKTISHASVSNKGKSVPNRPKFLCKNKTIAEQDLLRSVNRFLKSCRIKDESLSGSS